MTRTRSQAKQYQKLEKHLEALDECVFCDVRTDGFNPPIEEYDNFFVIDNKFPYDIWDEEGVLDHLLLIPKQHYDTVAGFTDQEAKEFVNILGDYESIGYDSFSRGPQSTQKSISHQHTHLIKLDRRAKRFVLKISNPKVLLHK